MVIRWSRIIETNEIPPLGDALRSHIDAYKGKVRFSSCSAWNLLYSILKENNMPDLEVAFTETGKPYFKEAALFFSISHSKDLCAAIISDRPAGIDIECCRDEYSAHLIERSLSKNEKALFDGDFTRLWCRKEAVAKMTGDGITVYPDIIDTTMYSFIEEQIEYGGHKYWLAAVTSQEYDKQCEFRH